VKPEPIPSGAESVKHSPARHYESDLTKILLGTSFHPGGLKLTEHLGTLLHLSSESRVLDVASGQRASSIFLAERFRCHVVGIDYSSQNVTQPSELVVADGLASRVRFGWADAERLPFPDASFDAVIYERTFCTLPNKSDAAREFARVLRSGGRVGLSDFTRGQMLPQELDRLLAWIPCIAGAQSVASYVEYLRSADFDVEKVEFHDEALTKLVHQIRIKLSNAKNLIALKKLALAGVDFTSSKQMAQSVLTAIQQSQLGYAILVAIKPSSCCSTRTRL